MQINVKHLYSISGTTKMPVFVVEMETLVFHLGHGKNAGYSTGYIDRKLSSHKHASASANPAPMAASTCVGLLQLRPTCTISVRMNLVLDLNLMPRNR